MQLNINITRADHYSVVDLSYILTLLPPKTVAECLKSALRTKTRLQKVTRGALLGVFTEKYFPKRDQEDLCPRAGS